MRRSYYIINNGDATHAVSFISPSIERITFEANIQLNSDNNLISRPYDFNEQRIECAVCTHIILEMEPYETAPISPQHRAKLNHPLRESGK